MPRVMNTKLGTVAVICVVLLLLVSRTSSFTDKNDKVDTIFNWFTANPGKSYNRYRKDLKEQSNVVEYDDVRRLAQGRDFTKDAVARVL